MGNPKEDIKFSASQKALEDVIRKNVESIAEYSKKTREEFNVTKDEVRQLKNMIIQQGQRIEQLEQQLQVLLAMKLNGGATD